MCGIAGFSLRTDIDNANYLIHRMLYILSHRGPDARGVSVGATMALGACRLSLVDIENGDQPYTNETGEITVVFNGEIYNDTGLRNTLQHLGHHLASQCDGEVISHLYEEFGEQFVEKLDGMYAIALWDNHKNKLMLASDPAGIKTLYFATENNDISFASELKCLRLLNHQFYVNPIAIGQYLQFKSIPSPLTPFRGIYKLCPGEVIVWQPNTPLRRNYTNGKRTGPDIDLLSSLQDAVVSTMRGDVDVGCIVSGGLDSSFVFQVMSTSSAKAIPVFAVGYPGDLEDDETKYAQRICAEFGGEFNKVVVDPDDIPDALQAVLWHLDEPIQDPITVPFYYLMKSVKNIVSAVMTGDGADELFGGYSRLRHWDDGKKGMSGYTQDLMLFNQREMTEHFSPDLMSNVFNHSEANVALSEIDDLKKAMIWERRYRLPSYHLLRADKLSMAWGVEARVPFLRGSIVDTANKLTAKELRCEGIEKYLLRHSVSPCLPKWLVDRRKKPFTFPISFWLRGKLKDWVNDTLFSPNALIKDWVSMDFVNLLWGEHCTNFRDNSHKLWALLVLELFLQQNKSMAGSIRGGLIDVSL